MSEIKNTYGIVYENKNYLKKMLSEYLVKNLGIENINKKFRCLNPDHFDEKPSMSYDKNNDFVHCFSCEATYDIFALIGFDYGIKSFNEQYKKACQIFSLSEINFKATEKPNLKTLAQEGTKVSKINLKPLNDKNIRDYILQCHKEVEKTNYFLTRGINDSEIIGKYKLGYDSETECVILPTSENYFIRRNTKEGNSRYYNLHSKATEMLNIEFLKSLGHKDTLFIVEGYFDALSVESFGEYSISLNSTSNISKFIELIREFKPECKLLISLDNDSTGKKAQKKLVKELENLEISFLEVDLCGEYKDPNEHLVSDSASFLRSIQEALEDAKKFDELKKRELEIKRDIYINENSTSNYLVNFLNYIEMSKNLNKIPTGFNQLDAILDGGLYEGLYIIGAISSLGKTTFVLQMADRIARSGQDVLIFSLEMSKNELIAKSLSRLTYLLGDNSTAKTVRGILDGKKHDNFSNMEKNIFKKSFDEYTKTSQNLYISESLGNLGVNEIKETISNHISLTGKLPIVIIDYLQILNPIDGRLTDKQNMDKSVSELKRISRDLKIPILAVSSLNRDNYNSKINMSAFKESGAIEYSSDVLIGLQLRGAGAKDFDVDKEKQKNPREIELKVLKNRNGRTGDIIQYEYYAMFNLFRETF